MKIGSTNSLAANNVADLFGNATTQETASFLYTSSAPLRFNSLLITEVMANPLPDQILPNREYIEIYNPSDERQSLFGLQFADARDMVSFPIAFIEAKEYIIVSPTSAINELKTYGKVIGLSPWPSLNNAGDALKLLNSRNELVFELNYSDDWYRETFKKEEGGWSLEMIDVRNPCGGLSNWTASRATIKGSPGMVNSAAESLPDSFGPSIDKAFAPSAQALIISFNESVNIDGLSVNNFKITPAIGVERLQVLNTSELLIMVSDAFLASTTYKVTVSNIFDCAGNLIQSEGSTASFALVETAVQGDVVLNEVLYNPANGGVDFIEIVNNSAKHINLKGWQVSGTSQASEYF